MSSAGQPSLTTAAEGLVTPSALMNLTWSGAVSFLKGLGALHIVSNPLHGCDQQHWQSTHGCQSPSNTSKLEF